MVFKGSWIFLEPSDRNIRTPADYLLCGFFAGACYSILPNGWSSDQVGPLIWPSNGEKASVMPALERTYDHFDSTEPLPSFFDFQSLHSAYVATKRAE